MRHSSPSHARRRLKIGRRSLGSVNTYCRCATGASTFSLDPLAVQEHALLVTARVRSSVSCTTRRAGTRGGTRRSRCAQTPRAGSPQAMKRSMTWRSTARRSWFDARPEARNCAAWRLAHCHSGLERGVRGRYSPPPGAIGPGHHAAPTLLPIERATRESGLQCAGAGHGLAEQCRVNCPAPGCVK